MPNTEVSTLEVVLAYNRWLDLCTGPGDYAGFYDFLLLADVGFVERTKEGYMVPDDVAQRIHILNGPNWYAILKAYRAIHMEEIRHAPSQPA